MDALARELEDLLVEPGAGVFGEGEVTRDQPGLIGVCDANIEGGVSRARAAVADDDSGDRAAVGVCQGDELGLGVLLARSLDAQPGVVSGDLGLGLDLLGL